MEQDVDLLGSGIGDAFGSHAGTVVAVLLHELADVLQGAVELVAGMQFSELEFGGVHDLVVAGMPGSAFHVNGADKKVERSGEGEHNIRVRGCDFGLDVCEASGGKKNANAIANLIPAEGLAGLLRKHLEQMNGICNAGEFNGFDSASDIRRHGGQR